MKKIIIIVIPILIILSFILILNRDKNLENYKGTTLNDSKEVKKIIGTQISFPVKSCHIGQTVHKRQGQK